MRSPSHRNNSSFNQVEFTAQKVAQFRTKYPRISQAQIQKMVQDSLKKEKQRLLATDKPSTDQKIDNEGNKNQSVAGLNLSPMNDPKKKLEFKDEEKIAVVVPRDNMDRSSNQGAEQVLSSTGTPQKKKKIKKIQKTVKDLEQIPQGLREYHKFSRFWRKKLREDHPRWTSNQVFQIICLLWRKKRMSQKKFKVPIVHPRRNPITGRKYFGDLKRKEENMEADQIKLLWWRLTKENKKYLGRLGTGGNGFTNPIKNMEKSIKIGHVAPIEIQSNPFLTFINSA